MCGDRLLVLRVGPLLEEVEAAPVLGVDVAEGAAEAQQPCLVGVQVVQIVAREQLRAHRCHVDLHRVDLHVPAESMGGNSSGGDGAARIKIGYDVSPRLSHWGRNDPQFYLTLR